MTMHMPMFRPPAEADSLILQIDTGCPHNRCTFCGMYREVAYRRADSDAIESLVRREARRDPEARRIFLADGDVMHRPFDDFRDLLLLLNRCFPNLARVGTYANGRSIAARSADELRTYRGLKLQTLYMGLESGSDDILRACHKPESTTQMIAAAQAAQAAGLRMSVMVLIGLGGVDRSAEHARCTAEVLNRMQPRLLSALRVIPVPGTELHHQVTQGRFKPLTEWAAVRELRDLLKALDLQTTVFRANHASNIVPLEGRLPKDQDLLVAQLDALLDSNHLDRTSPGPTPLWL